MASKRTYSQMMDQSDNKFLQVSALPMFETFREELDLHYDRRERLVKYSRDITTASKKIIFALQRTRNLGISPLPRDILEAQSMHLKNIRNLALAAANETHGINGFRYQRSVSPGLQEWVEAMLFQHYLEFQVLLPYEDLASQLAELSSSSDKQLILTIEDYLLGLYDMTGEVMRFGITTIATTGKLPSNEAANSHAEASAANLSRDVLTDLRDIRQLLQALNVDGGSILSRDADRKMDVLNSSVLKVEAAVYGLVVRGSERPKGWIAEPSTTLIMTEKA